jgi:hypothetical protein
MIETLIVLSDDKCKALLLKYFGIDVDNFVAYIGTKHGDNVLTLSSDEIIMTFNEVNIEEIIVDFFNSDVSKIDNVHAYIINKEDRKYVSFTCAMSIEGIKSIMDIIW